MLCRVVRLFGLRSRILGWRGLDRRSFSFFFDHFAYGVHIGILDFDVNVIAEFGLVGERVGFGGQAQGVEGH